MRNHCQSALLNRDDLNAMVRENCGPSLHLHVGAFRSTRSVVFHLLPDLPWYEDGLEAG